MATATADKIKIVKHTGLAILSEELGEYLLRAYDQEEKFDRDRLQKVCDVMLQDIAEGDYPIIKVGHRNPDGSTQPAIGRITNAYLEMRKGMWTLCTDWEVYEHYNDLIKEYPHRSSEINTHTNRIPAVAVCTNPALKSLGAYFAFETKDNGNIICLSDNELCEGEKMNPAELRAQFEQILESNPALQHATRLMLEAQRQEDGGVELEAKDDKPEDDDKEKDKETDDKPTDAHEGDESPEDDKEPAPSAEDDSEAPGDDSEGEAPVEGDDKTEDESEAPTDGEDGQGGSDSDSEGDDDEEDDKKELEETEPQTLNLAEQYQREALEYKVQLEDITAKYDQAEQEATKYKSMYTRETREKDLILLQREGVRFDLQSELNDVLHLSDEKYNKHVERMRKHYARAPVGLAKRINTGGEYKLSSDDYANIRKYALKHNMKFDEATTKYLKGQ